MMSDSLLKHREKKTTKQRVCMKKELTKKQEENHKFKVKALICGKHRD